MMRHPKHVRPPEVERTHPAPLLVGMWLMALALSVLGAAEVSAWIVHDPTLGAHPRTLQVASALVRWSEATRARRFSEAVDDLATRAKPDVVWLRSETVTPEPAIVRAEPAPAPSTVARASVGAASGPSPLADPRATEDFLLIGASSMHLHFGAELERGLRSSYRGVTVKRFGKIATGLVRTDYFDWPKKTSALLAASHPRVVIAQFGGNDAQSIAVDGRAPLLYATPEWDQEFGRRVTALATLVQSRGARFILVGMPMMRDPGFSRRMQHLNGIMQRHVEQSGGTFISTWDLSGAHGKYSNSVTLDGATHLLRSSDGVHFTRAGAVYMARKVAERLERELLLVPADEARAVVVRREIVSKALGRSATYFAYVPQPVARGAGRLPVLYLLHGAEGGFAEWSEHAQRSIQELSVQHGLIIVTPEGSGNESRIVDEVVADVEASLPVDARRGIGGLSAGGNAAIALALERPGIFWSASSLSGAVELTALVHRRADVARGLPMLVTVGVSDRWVQDNRAFAKELTALGIVHTFDVHEGGHDWNTWMGQLPRHVAWHAERLRKKP